MPSSSKISFTLLTIYATQVLPESLLKGLDLKQICKFLDVTLEELKETSSEPSQTISVESLLISLGVNLDELSILLEVPKKFIPWISKEPRVINFIEPESRFILPRMSDRASLFRGVDEEEGFFISEELSECLIRSFLPWFPC